MDGYGYLIKTYQTQYVKLIPRQALQAHMATGSPNWRTPPTGISLVGLTMPTNHPATPGSDMVRHGWSCMNPIVIYQNYWEQNLYHEKNFSGTSNGGSMRFFFRLFNGDAKGNTI